jgi:hypothetical protein
VTSRHLILNFNSFSIPSAHLATPMVQIKVGPQSGAGDGDGDGDGPGIRSANPAPIQPVSHFPRRRHLLVPAHPQPRPSTSSEDSGSLVNLSSLSLDQPPSADYEHVAPPPQTSGMTPPDRRAKLLYCKSHVSIHPTAFNKDNISGYLGIVEVESSSPSLLVTWTPDELLERMDEKDREGFKRVDGKFGTADREEDGGSSRSPQLTAGFVFVSLPPPRGEKYAFSVPVPSIYSVLVYPPSLSHWYGSATFNLAGGVSLPTLFFHDDESPLLSSPPTLDSAASPPRPQWGFPPFLSLLQTHCTLLQSRSRRGLAVGVSAGTCRGAGSSPLRNPPRHSKAEPRRRAVAHQPEQVGPGGARGGLRRGDDPAPRHVPAETPTAKPLRDREHHAAPIIHDVAIQDHQLFPRSGERNPVHPSCPARGASPTPRCSLPRLRSG